MRVQTLDRRAFPAIFLRYAHTQMAYKLMNVYVNRAVVSIDVEYSEWATATSFCPKLSTIEEDYDHLLNDAPIEDQNASLNKFIDDEPEQYFNPVSHSVPICEDYNAEDPIASKTDNVPFLKNLHTSTRQFSRNRRAPRPWWNDTALSTTKQ